MEFDFLKIVYIPDILYIEFLGLIWIQFFLTFEWLKIIILG